MLVEMVDWVGTLSQWASLPLIKHLGLPVQTPAHSSSFLLSEAPSGAVFRPVIDEQTAQRSRRPIFAVALFFPELFLVLREVAVRGSVPKLLPVRS
jgi:hypothetical protein